MKKIAKSCLLILLTALAIVGTRAYYTTTITSSGNTITSANFIVKPDGNLDGNQEFKIEKFAPGKSQIYKFSINKTGTQVPVVYNINFLKSEDLFTGNTPVKLTLVKYSDETNYEIVNAASVDNSYILYPQNDVETYGLKADWSWDSSSDTDSTTYAGKTGNITVKVRASQLAADPVNPSDTQNINTVRAYVCVTDYHYEIKSPNYDTKDNDREIVFNKSLRTIKISNTTYLGDAVFLIDGQLVEDKPAKGKLIYCSKDVGYSNGSTFVHYANTEGWDITKDGNTLSFLKLSDGKNISIRAQNINSSISDWQ